MLRLEGVLPPGFQAPWTLLSQPGSSRVITRQKWKDMCFKNCWSRRIHFSHCLFQAVYPDYPGPHNNGGADSSLPAPHAPMSFLPLNSKEFSEFTLLHLHILQHICQASGSSHWLFSLFRTPSSRIRTTLPPSLPSSFCLHITLPRKLPWPSCQ